ncbi:hypothetical protein ILP97_40145 [Amycolatopsis sp. H6(2020)]|nr:hypothetical protein [Amycolatopsis sp. H6(2020)]
MSRWQPAAGLLRAIGADWDRRAHRVPVLAANWLAAVRGSRTPNRA